MLKGKKTPVAESQRHNSYLHMYVFKHQVNATANTGTYICSLKQGDTQRSPEAFTLDFTGKSEIS